MAQIAQQDNIVVDFGTIESFDDVSEEAKKQLRRAYIRGTILDVVIKLKSESFESVGNIVAAYVVNNRVNVYIVDTINDNLKGIDCGAVQPEDYSDDIPYDGE